MTTKALTKSIKKISSTPEKLGNIGYKSIEFYHKATLGDSEIDLAGLVMPTAVQSTGFLNPPVSRLVAANLKYSRSNLILKSDARGIWVDRVHYNILSNGRIKLLRTALTDEVFHGVIQGSVRQQVEGLDMQSLSIAGTLAEGATVFNIGKLYKTNINPLTQLGEILVFRGNQLSLMLRNAGNASANVSADGNYCEVDSGNGYGSTIEFNDAGAAGGENIVVVSTGRLLERPNSSLLQEIESIAGTLDTIVPYIEELMDLEAGSLKPTPSNADLKAFGDTVLDLKGKYDSARKVSDLTKTKYQIKGGTGTRSTSQALTDYTFNNLEIGKTYRVSFNLSTTHPNTAFSSATVDGVHNGATIMTVKSDQSNSGGNIQGETRHSSSKPFVASATTVTFNFTSTGAATCNLASYAMLEELPNHEITTQWT
jgi:hypothetical protein